MIMGPLREPTFLILTALAAGPQHGYGIMTDVARISGSRVALRAGTLYAALDRLRTESLVDVEREEVVDGRLRRYYQLTAGGTQALTGEVARLQANAAVAASRLAKLGVAERPGGATAARLAGGAA
jgi:DNA-binding PadR family transcriptional regulator